MFIIVWFTRGLSPINHARKTLLIDIYYRFWIGWRLMHMRTLSLTSPLSRIYKLGEIYQWITFHEIFIVSLVKQREYPKAEHLVSICVPIAASMQQSEATSFSRHSVSLRFSFEMWKISIGHGSVETREDDRTKWTNLCKDSLNFSFVAIGTRSRTRRKKIVF